MVDPRGPGAAEHSRQPGAAGRTAAAVGDRCTAALPCREPVDEPTFHNPSCPCCTHEEAASCPLLGIDELFGRAFARRGAPRLAARPEPQPLPSLLAPRGSPALGCAFPHDLCFPRNPGCCLPLPSPPFPNLVPNRYYWHL